MGRKKAAATRRVVPGDQAHQLELPAHDHAGARNPLVAVPRNNGLNSNYNYIDIGRVYRPHKQLWCNQRGTRMVCSRHRR
jgi:hypothetical protein